MRASDLQTTFPLVGRDSSALEAARLIAADRLAGLVVVDRSGIPAAVVSAVDVLKLMLPGYVLDDLSLAGVFDEGAAEEVFGHAKDHTIGELLDDESVRVYDLLVVEPDATIVEVAARMADARAQVAQVKGAAGAPPVFLTLPVVLDAVLALCSPRPNGEDGA
ncbi:CBS domain-containing protein [Lacisediminihabitans sp. FW035]